jgi:RNA polymerase sigma-70 factor (ECF subfamily)
LQLYVERFNRQDWDGLRELIAADARLRVADRFAGPLTGSPYFGNYERIPVPWRLAVGDVDGEPMVVLLHRGADAWTPHSLVHLEVAGDRITRIADYWHTPWVFQEATSVVVSAL